MKLQSSAVAATTSGSISSREMRASDSSKIFHIVMDGIYKDKVGSIVRELATNAADSHRDAGTPELPFEITAPTRFEPYFTVRDYGVSMTPDLVDDVYSVLMESTKDQDNTTVGAWGVGSKSPLSYTDNFTVMTFLDGIQRVYSIYLNAGEKPYCDLQAELPTDEPNGVQVTVPVKESDINLWLNKIQEQLCFFDVKFNVTNFDIRYPVVTSEYGPLKVLENNGVSRGIKIVQGGVAYPLGRDYIELIEGEFPEQAQMLRELLDSNICAIVKFEIGEISVPISRESVEYKPQTVENIRVKLWEAVSELRTKFDQELPRAADFKGYDRAFKWAEATNTWVNNANCQSSFESSLLRACIADEFKNNIVELTTEFYDFFAKDALEALRNDPDTVDDYKRFKAFVDGDPTRTSFSSNRVLELSGMKVRPCNHALTMIGAMNGWRIRIYDRSNHNGSWVYRSVDHVDFAAINNDEYSDILIRDLANSFVKRINYSVNNDPTYSSMHHRLFVIENAGVGSFTQGEKQSLMELLFDCYGRKGVTYISNMPKPPKNTGVRVANPRFFVYDEIGANTINDYFDDSNSIADLIDEYDKIILFKRDRDDFHSSFNLDNFVNRNRTAFYRNVDTPKMLSELGYDGYVRIAVTYSDFDKIMNGKYAKHFVTMDGMIDEVAKKVDQFLDDNKKEIVKFIKFQMSTRDIFDGTRQGLAGGFSTPRFFKEISIQDYAKAFPKHKKVLLGDEHNQGFDIPEWLGGQHMFSGNYSEVFEQAYGISFNDVSKKREDSLEKSIAFWKDVKARLIQNNPTLTVLILGEGVGYSGKHFIEDNKLGDDFILNQLKSALDIKG